MHGPDFKVFDPEKLPDKISLRKKYNLPVDKKLLVFAGRPVFYNGLDFVMNSLAEHESEWELILAGNQMDPIFKKAKEKLSGRCHLLGFIPNNAMPEILKLADVAPIVQKPIPTTEMQMPAKLLEAMCMEKGIIVTRVGDLPEIVTEERGWVIQPGDDKGFRAALQEISDNPLILDKKGKAAREFFIQNASVQEIARRIKPYFE